MAARGYRRIPCMWHKRAILLAWYDLLGSCSCVSRPSYDVWVRMSMPKGDRPEDEHAAWGDARRSGWADVGPVATRHGESGRVGLRIALVLRPLHVDSG